jgi:DNA-binding response OmpR family regulator
MRVLVIEDDALVGAAIQMILDREGCQTVHARDADSGIEAFESSSFDLVIVDIFIPGVNGLKTIAGLCNRAPTISILAISGFRFRGSMDPGLDFLSMAASVGATVCLRKPFTHPQLMAAVRASFNPALSNVSSVAIETQHKDRHDGTEHLSLQYSAVSASA